MDEFKLTKDTLHSVNKDVDYESERLYAQLFSELEETDRRVSRLRQHHERTSTCGTMGGSRGKGKGKDKSKGRGRRKGSRGVTTGLQTYVRRGSSSTRVIEDLAEEDDPLIPSPELREPEFDDDGNLLSEGDFVFTSDSDEDEVASDDYLASDHASDDDSFTFTP